MHCHLVEIERHGGPFRQPDWANKYFRYLSRCLCAKLMALVNIVTSFSGVHLHLVLVVGSCRLHRIPRNRDPLILPGIPDPQLVHGLLRLCLHRAGVEKVQDGNQEAD